MADLTWGRALPAEAGLYWRRAETKRDALGRFLYAGIVTVTAHRDFLGTQYLTMEPAPWPGVPMVYAGPIPAPTGDVPPYDVPS